MSANARNATLSPQKTMTIEENKTNNEAAIRELIDGFVKAIRAKDINGVMSFFASEVVSFDLGPPLQHGGGETFVKCWQELFESYQNPIDYEVRDLNITAGYDVGFSYSLNRVSGTMKNGRKSDRWLRWTACYRKTNGKWLIVHEHLSVPIDLGNGKAMLDLKP
jgi:ketosteroid isomerase-like protein